MPGLQRARGPRLVQREDDGVWAGVPWTRGAAVHEVRGVAPLGAAEADTEAGRVQTHEAARLNKRRILRTKSGWAGIGDI